MSGKCEGCQLPFCGADGCQLCQEESESLKGYEMAKAAAEGLTAGLKAPPVPGIVAAIKKALGIRSPSETFMESYQDEHDVSGLLED